VMEGRVGAVDAARRLFRHAVAADPTCAPAWQAWACMEHKAGDCGEARRLFQRGVNADPCHVAVWQAWADMEGELGEWDEGPACSLPSASRRT
jgi:predicted Zn-dependent protease